MGLDVTVYNNVNKSNSEEDYCFTAYVVSEQWEYKIKNLEKDAEYTGDVVGSGISYACGSHGRFRETLLKMINRSDLLDENGCIDWESLEKDTELPFYDFIDFADNEGCLDWEISAKLYEHFEAWKIKAQEYALNDGYFGTNYARWLDIFSNGKNKDSVVVFH